MCPGVAVCYHSVHNNECFIHVLYTGVKGNISLARAMILNDDRFRSIQCNNWLNR